MDYSSTSLDLLSLSDKGSNKDCEMGLKVLQSRGEGNREAKRARFPSDLEESKEGGARESEADRLAKAGSLGPTSVPEIRLCKTISEVFRNQLILEATDAISSSSWIPKNPSLRQRRRKGFKSCMNHELRQSGEGFKA